MDVIVALLSLLPCACLLGGGAGFLVADMEKRLTRDPWGCAGEAGTGTGPVVEWDALGGVGGRGVGISASGASGSMSTSGILPAASRSNTLSLKSSTCCLGAGGSGLFKSVGEPVGDARPASSSLVWSAPLELSFPNPTLISFPRLEAGGAGFLRDVVRGGCVVYEDSRPCWSSSPSGSDISCDVRGVSVAGWPLLERSSEMDCRDIDEASVMLAASA